MADVTQRSTSKSKSTCTRAPHDVSPVFHRTKMCRFHLLGCCKRGDSCLFAHTVQDLKSCPDFTRTRLCERLLTKGICRVPDCKFAHNREELRSRVNIGAVKPKQELSKQKEGGRARKDDATQVEEQDHSIIVLKSACDGEDDDIMPANGWSRQSTEEPMDDSESVLDFDEPFSRQATEEEEAQHAALPPASEIEMYGIQCIVRHGFLHFRIVDDEDVREVVRPSSAPAEVANRTWTARAT